MFSLIRSRLATGVASVLVGVRFSPTLVTSREDDDHDDVHADADADADGVDTNVVSPDMDVEVVFSPPAGKERRLCR